VIALTLSREVNCDLEIAYRVIAGINHYKDFLDYIEDIEVLQISSKESLKEIVALTKVKEKFLRWSYNCLVRLNDADHSLVEIFIRPNRYISSLYVRWQLECGDSGTFVRFDLECLCQSKFFETLGYFMIKKYINVTVDSFVLEMQRQQAQK